MEQTAENEALTARKRRDEDMITIERCWNSKPGQGRPD